MTQDEIIAMAIKARLVERIDECHRAIRPKWIEDHDITTYVEAFAKLVAHHEREECAKVCESDDSEAGEWHYEAHVGGYFAREIRERGEA